MPNNNPSTVWLLAQFAKKHRISKPERKILLASDFCFSNPVTVVDDDPAATRRSQTRVLESEIAAPLANVRDERSHE